MSGLSRQRREKAVLNEAKRWYRKNGEWWIHHFGAKHPDPVVQLAVAVRNLVKETA